MRILHICVHGSGTYLEPGGEVGLCASNRLDTPVIPQYLCDRQTRKGQADIGLTSAYI